MNPPALRQKRLPRGLSRQFHLDFAMRIAAKVGIKILQPSIVKYTIPFGFDRDRNRMELHVRKGGRENCQKHFKDRGGQT